jgi:hypothetical protein
MAMLTVEYRLKALEKRTRIDDERWQTLAAQQTAFTMIFEAIGAPVCAASPVVFKTIIKNLKTFEVTARMTNEHAKTIEEFRHLREFFERQIKKAGNGDTPSSKRRRRRR